MGDWNQHWDPQQQWDAAPQWDPAPQFDPAAVAQQWGAQQWPELAPAAEAPQSDWPELAPAPTAPQSNWPELAPGAALPEPVTAGWANAWAAIQTEAVEAQQHVAVNAAVAQFSKSYADAANSYAGPSGSKSSKPVTKNPINEGWDPTSLLPEVAELCKKFDIDDNRAFQLNELLEPRKDTREEDMQRLWNDLERSRNPMGLLIAKIKQLREGSFIGQMRKNDPELQHFKRKFNLDSEAQRRLEECISRHTPELRQKYYVELELHLEASHNPSALIMMMLKKLASGESLGEVKEQPQPVGKGKGKKGAKGDDSRRRGSRSRSRGGRARSRSRRAQRESLEEEDKRKMREFEAKWRDTGDRDGRDRNHDGDRRDRDRDQYRQSDRSDDRRRHDDRGRDDRGRDDRNDLPPLRRGGDQPRSSGDKAASDSKAAPARIWTAPKIKIS